MLIIVRGLQPDVVKQYAKNLHAHSNKAHTSLFEDTGNNSIDSLVEHYIKRRNDVVVYGEFMNNSSMTKYMHIVHKTTPVRVITCKSRHQHTLHPRWVDTNTALFPGIDMSTEEVLNDLPMPIPTLDTIASLDFPPTTTESTPTMKLPTLTRTRTSHEAMAANVLYYGPPGVGKTAIIEQSYDHYFKLLASSMQEEDIAGLPYLEEIDSAKPRRARRHGFTTHRWFTRANALAAKGARVGIIFDEVDKARRSVADTLLTFFASRELPDSDGRKRKLHPNIDIIAIANNAGWGGGDGISEPMQNRFAAVEFVPNLIEWVKWARAEFDENNPQVMNVLLQFASRKLQLVETAGENEHLRITSPRSIAAALTICINKHEYSTPYASWEERVRGWVTPNTATAIVAAFKAADRDTKSAATATNTQAAAGERTGMGLDTDAEEAVDTEAVGVDTDDEF